MANFLFVLRDNNNEKATRCFQFAKIAHGKGHRVNLFFIDSGVDWAMKDRDGGPHLIDMAAEAKVFNF